MRTPSAGNEGEEQNVRKIEAAIDELPLGLPILKRPLEFSVWNVLCAHELIVSDAMMKEAADGVDSLETTDSAKNGLKYAIRWIHSSCKPRSEFRAPRSIRSDRFDEALTILRLGMQYHPFETACREWSNGRAEARAVDERTIEFRWHEAELKYDVLDKLTYHYSKHPLSSEQETTHLEVIENVKDVLRTAAVATDNQLQFDQGVAEGEVLIEDSLRAMSKILPEDWSFGALTGRLFRRVWAALRSICHLHLLCHAKLLGFKNPLEYDWGRSVMVTTRDSLLQRICRFGGIEERDHVGSIVDILTYSPSVPNADPALQPLLSLGEHLAIAPSLVMSSRFDRNLMALLARGWRADYDRASGLLEPHMLEEMKVSFQDAGFSAEHSVKLPRSLGLPDVDLAVLDADNGIVLLIETKWVNRWSWFAGQFGGLVKVDAV